MSKRLMLATMPVALVVSTLGVGTLGVNAEEVGKIYNSKLVSGEWVSDGVELSGFDFTKYQESLEKAGTDSGYALVDVNVRIKNLVTGEIKDVGKLSRFGVEGNKDVFVEGNVYRFELQGVYLLEGQGADESEVLSNYESTNYIVMSGDTPIKENKKKVYGAVNKGDVWSAVGEELNGFNFGRYENELVNAGIEGGFELLDANIRGVNIEDGSEVDFGSLSDFDLDKINQMVEGKAYRFSIQGIYMLTGVGVDGMSIETDYTETDYVVIVPVDEDTGEPPVDTSTPMIPLEPSIPIVPPVDTSTPMIPLEPSIPIVPPVDTSTPMIPLEPSIPIVPPVDTSTPMVPLEPSIPIVPPVDTSTPMVPLEPSIPIVPPVDTSTPMVPLEPSIPIVPPVDTDTPMVPLEPSKPIVPPVDEGTPVEPSKPIVPPVDEGTPSIPTDPIQPSEPTTPPKEPETEVKPVEPPTQTEKPNTQKPTVIKPGDKVTVIDEEKVHVDLEVKEEKDTGDIIVEVILKPKEDMVDVDIVVVEKDKGNGNEKEHIEKVEDIKKDEEVRVDIPIKDGKDKEFTVVIKTPSRDYSSNRIEMANDSPIWKYEDVKSREKVSAYDAIYEATRLGIVTGDTVNGVRYFKPNSNVTRAQITAMILRSLGIEYEEYKGKPFTDTEGKWYQGAVGKARDLGIVNGYTDGEFKGDEYITREHLTAMLKRAYVVKGYESTKGNFIDVAETRWTYSSVNTLYELSAIKGYDDGTFRPKNNATRAQSVTMITGILGSKSEKVDLVKYTGVEGEFLDVLDKALNYGVVNEIKN